MAETRKLKVAGRGFAIRGEAAILADRAETARRYEELPEDLRDTVSQLGAFAVKDCGAGYLLAVRHPNPNELMLKAAGLKAEQVNAILEYWRDAEHASRFPLTIEGKRVKWLRIAFKQTP